MRRVPGAAIGSRASNGRPEACASRWRSVEPGGPAGSSRSTIPSSAATSTATAVASFVTDAQRRRRSTLAVRRLRAVRVDHCRRRRGRTASRRLAAAPPHGDTTGDGSPAHLVRRRVRGTRRLLARRARRSTGLGVRDGADHARRRRSRRRTPYEQARICLEIIGRALAEAGASLDDVVRTRIYVTRAAYIDDGRARPPRGVRDRPPGDDRASSPSCSTRAGWSRSRSKRSSRRRSSPSTGQARARRRGRGERPRPPLRRRASRTRSASRRSTCCSTRETWDLVQHIDSVLARVDRGRVRGADHARADAVGDRDHDARSAGRRPRSTSSSRSSAATSPRSPRADGCRFASAGTHPFSLFERQRITAKDRYRKLVDQMQYIARRELIFGMHVHAAVDDPDKAIQVVNGLLIHLPEFLALSASSPFWRGEPTGLLLVAPDGLLRLPALGRAAAVRELRGVRRARRPARADGLHRRLHPYLVGHPAAPAARHGRAPHLRRRHPRRGRGRALRLLPGAREDALRARRVGRNAAELPPDPDHREQVARRTPRPRRRP